MAEGVDHTYIGGELDLFALARNWKSYVKKEIADYLHGDVLEVGAGIGGTTMALHGCSARHWVCLEPDATLAVRLQGRLRSRMTSSALSVVAGTLSAFAAQPRFDCILYVDVLEHIEDDHGQIASAARLIRSGGHIIVLSPAHQWLFSAFDKSIGHLRRYNKLELRRLRPADCTEQKLKYLDSTGILLSLGNVVALRQSMPTEAQILTWDRFCIPASRFIDRITRGNIGKSILAVWCKQ